MKAFRHLKATLDVLSSVGVLVAVALLAWAQFGRSGPPPRPPAKNVDGMRIAGERLAHLQGTSKIVLIEFADFECPVCIRHAQEAFPLIKKELIDTGVASYAFVNFPLMTIHPRAFPASIAAECAAGQDKYWEMHERLFSASGALLPEELKEYADELRLNREAFDGCLKSDEPKVRVRGDIEQATKLGVTGTPSFFIATRNEDGSVIVRRRFDGYTPVNDFRQAIDSLAGAPSPRSNSE